MLTGAEAPSTTLTGPSGEQLVLPPEVFEVLRDVVTAMARGQAVTIAPVHQRLTTQEAADLLGISRPTFVKLLERATSHTNSRGATDESCCLTCWPTVSAAPCEHESLDHMVEIADESGMYELTATPKRTR